MEENVSGAEVEAAMVLLSEVEEERRVMKVLKSALAVGDMESLEQGVQEARALGDSITGTELYKQCKAARKALREALKAESLKAAPQ